MEKKKRRAAAGMPDDGQAGSGAHGLGFAGALLRSELLALDVAADLVEDPAGLWVRVRKSKIGQENRA